MKNFGDITKIDGHCVPLVDVIVGGSPCQDLSDGGKRAGLSGARSGLFFEQTRIIKEMHENAMHTNNVVRLPRFFVWENVTGALKSNGGRDFQKALSEIVRVAEPNAPDVPLPTWGGWNKSGALFGMGADGRPFSVGWRIHNAQFWGTPQRRSRVCVVADYRGTTASEILFVRKSMYGDFEPCGTEKTQTAGKIQNGTDDTIWCYSGGGYDSTITPPLSAGMNKIRGATPLLYGLTDFANYTHGCAPLRARGGDYGGGSENLCCDGKTVRRLTPIECERLNGFPDDWTNIGEWTDSKGRKRQTSDAQRYKALGNSIALPFWFWLLRRISAQYERPATMASLFDGIGGFPLCWERCNGKGTAIWCSEIDEFACAVTRARFS